MVDASYADTSRTRSGIAHSSRTADGLPPEGAGSANMRKALDVFRYYLDTHPVPAEALPRPVDSTVTMAPGATGDASPMLVAQRLGEEELPDRELWGRHRAESVPQAVPQAASLRRRAPSPMPVPVHVETLRTEPSAVPLLVERVPPEQLLPEGPAMRLPVESMQAAAFLTRFGGDVVDGEALVGGLGAPWAPLEDNYRSGGPGANMADEGGTFGGRWAKVEDAVAASEEVVTRLRRTSGWNTPSTDARSTTSAAFRAMAGDACSSIGSEEGAPPVPHGHGALTGQTLGSGQGLGGNFSGKCGGGNFGGGNFGGNSGAGHDPRSSPGGVGLGGAALSATTPGSTKISPGGAPPARDRVFRRRLYESELTLVRSLVAPPMHDLKDLATREFDWALSVGGHVPGRPGHVDFVSALTALRQLAYLNGLPAISSDAATWFFDASIMRERNVGVQDIVFEEFEAAVEAMFQHAAGG